MITIDKQPQSVNVLFAGSLVEKVLQEDEYESFTHPFVLEIAVDQQAPAPFSLALHWTRTEPQDSASWERKILEQAAADLKLHECQPHSLHPI